MKSSKLFGALAFGATCFSLFAQPAPIDGVRREAVETIIKEYLLRNPSIVRDALHALEAQAAAAEAERIREAIAAHRNELLNDKDSVVAGNPQGDVTIVEFFDYRCSYCKRVASALDAVVQRDGNVRIVLKEFPILGPDSVHAAKAALASRRAGKYLDVHRGLMAAQDLDQKSIEEIARAGLSGDFKSAIEEPSLDEAIRKNHLLGNQLDISGTPALIIGDRIVRGAADAETLLMMVTAERHKQKETRIPATAAGN